jgi:act minimal PKS ketosynthase (KS/KS alpha)
MLTKSDASDNSFTDSGDVGVVVTGLGVVAPGACGVHEFRNLLREGRSAASIDQDLVSRSFGCHVSARGKLTQAALDQTFSDLEQRRLLNTGHRYSIAAGLEAFTDSGLQAAEDQPNTRWSIVFGVGLPGIDTLRDAIANIDAGRNKRPPLLLEAAITASAPGIWSIRA